MRADAGGGTRDRWQPQGAAFRTWLFMLAQHLPSTCRVAARVPALLAMISQYVRISPSDIKLSLERQDNFAVLEVKIELPDDLR